MTDGKLGTLTPFLKWAGGKRWFAQRFLQLIPNKFNRYIEPFLGSGAIFFALRPQSAILSDLNSELIESYVSVREAPEVIEELLSRYQVLHSKEHYYETRANKPENQVERAAWLIYLNRTCWNGLYRVNLNNQFNVPIGTKSQVVLPTDDFHAISNALKQAHLIHQDFEKTLDMAADGDFVFIDPPYTVKHNLNGFLKYNDHIFSWTDQIRLRDAVARAASRGAMVLVTNANHRSVSEIYEGVGGQTVLSRASVLAASSAHRTNTEELMIRTWVEGA